MLCCHTLTQMKNINTFPKSGIGMNVFKSTIEYKKINILSEDFLAILLIGLPMILSMFSIPGDFSNFKCVIRVNVHSPILMYVFSKLFSRYWEFHNWSAMLNIGTLLSVILAGFSIFHMIYIISFETQHEMSKHAQMEIYAFTSAFGYLFLAP